MGRSILWKYLWPDCTYCGPLSDTQLSGSIYLQVVDAADVILEVLDARDPLGSRCQEMEDLILGSSTDKRLVLVLNKIGLSLQSFDIKIKI